MSLYNQANDLVIIVVPEYSIDKKLVQTCHYQAIMNDEGNFRVYKNRRGHRSTYMKHRFAFLDVVSDLAKILSIDLADPACGGLIDPHCFWDGGGI